MGRTGLATALLSVALIGCGGGVAPSTDPIAPGTADPGTSTLPSPSPTPSATASGRPSPTPVPGFEDGGVIQPWVVDIAHEDDGTLRMRLLTRALWFHQERGALLWKPVTGDFTMSATVRAASATDPSSPPPANGVTQLGGLMARGDESSENYVFIVVGNNVSGPTVETKTTTNSRSTWDAPSWDATAAELRMCRSGSVFRLLKRPADSDEAWVLAAEIDRPDLPAELQVGPNIYSDGRPDLLVHYEDLEIAPGDPGDACATG